MRSLWIPALLLTCAVACDPPKVPTPKPVPGPAPGKPKPDPEVTPKPIPKIPLKENQYRASVAAHKVPGYAAFGAAALSPKFSTAGSIENGPMFADLDALSGLTVRWGYRYEIIVEAGEMEEIQGHKFRPLKLVTVVLMEPEEEGETFSIPFNAAYFKGEGETLALLDGKAFRCKDAKVKEALEKLRKIPAPKGPPGDGSAEATFAFGETPDSPLILVSLKLP